MGHAMKEPAKKTRRTSATLEDQYVLRIQDCWRRSTDSIIELAIACREADEAWDVKTKHKRIGSRCERRAGLIHK